MFAFYLKKNFCDGWDNFFFLVLSNAVNIALLAASYFALRYADEMSPYLFAPALVFFSSLLSVSLFAWGASLAKIADFRSPSFALYLSALRDVWRVAALFGAMVSAVLILIRFALSYYLRMYFLDGSLLGLVMTAALGWFVFVSVIALQYFIPLYFLQESNGFVKCLRKSFIIFYDNVAFSVQLFLVNLLLFVLSCVTFMIVPGLNGITLSCMNALRLRLYKYDWIERMSGDDPDFQKDREKRNEVPWEELLAEDKESLGPRKLGSFLFPWK